MNYHFYEAYHFGFLVVLTPWKVIGLVGALLFASRWFVQAYYSRKAGRPVTPRIFWIMSVIGSVMALSYFLFGEKLDMVGVTQNLFPSVIAAYNLYLDIRHGREQLRSKATATATASTAASVSARLLPTEKAAAVAVK